MTNLARVLLPSPGHHGNSGSLAAHGMKVGDPANTESELKTSRRSVWIYVCVSVCGCVSV